MMCRHYMQFQVQRGLAGLCAGKGECAGKGLCAVQVQVQVQLQVQGRLAGLYDVC